jgi:large subunit ribosomal protein L25
MAQVPRQTAIQLAKALPPRLQYFLKKWPTPAVLGLAKALTPTESPSTDSTIPPDSQSNAFIPHGVQGAFPTSPFDAFKHPVTGKWHPPAYSLRRQAELVKLAQQHGVEDLLPYSIKGSAEKQRRREEHGLRVKGTGVGQKVKGKEWERTLKGRLVLHYWIRTREKLLTHFYQTGETSPSYAGDATDDSDLEGERAWSWVEEMAEIDLATTIPMMGASGCINICTWHEQYSSFALLMAHLDTKAQIVSQGMVAMVETSCTYRERDALRRRLNIPLPYMKYNLQCHSNIWCSRMCPIGKPGHRIQQFSLS